MVQNMVERRTVLEGNAAAVGISAGGPALSVV